MNKIHSVSRDALYLAAALNILWLGMMLERERESALMESPPCSPLNFYAKLTCLYATCHYRWSVRRTLQRAPVSVSTLYFIFHVIVYIQTPLSISSHQASFSCLSFSVGVFPQLSLPVRLHLPPLRGSGLARR